MATTTETTKAFSPIASYVQSQLGYLQSKYDEMATNLENDFTYYLSWYAEEMYCNKVYIREMKRWQDRLEDVGEDLFFDTQIEAYQKFLSSTYNIMGSSTNQVANLCTSWKYKTILELCNTLQTWKQ